MPDNPLDDQLHQEAHADQIREERAVMDQGGLTREQARQRIEAERNKPVAAAPAGKPMPMLAMAPLKLDGNCLSIDPNALGNDGGSIGLIAGNKDGRPAIFQGSFTLVRLLA